MRTRFTLLSLAENGLEVLVKSVVLAHEVVRKVPLAGGIIDQMLDTVLGPEEAFDYKPTTAPITTSTQ